MQKSFPAPLNVPCVIVHAPQRLLTENNQHWHGQWNARLGEREGHLHAVSGCQVTVDELQAGQVGHALGDVNAKQNEILDGGVLQEQSHAQEQVYGTSASVRNIVKCLHTKVTVSSVIRIAQCQVES